MLMSQGSWTVVSIWQRKEKRLFEGVREIGQLVTALERLAGYLFVNVGEVKRLLADNIR
jgi:hypothetical protein